jgi:hypothetical protein
MHYIMILLMKISAFLMSIPSRIQDGLAGFSFIFVNCEVPMFGTINSGRKRVKKPGRLKAVQLMSAANLEAARYDSRVFCSCFAPKGATSRAGVANWWFIQASGKLPGVAGTALYHYR